MSYEKIWSWMTRVNRCLWENPLGPLFKPSKEMDCGGKKWLERRVQSLPRNRMQERAGIEGGLITTTYRACIIRHQQPPMCVVPPSWITTLSIPRLISRSTHFSILSFFCSGQRLFRLQAPNFWSILERTLHLFIFPTNQSRQISNASTVAIGNRTHSFHVATGPSSGPSSLHSPQLMQTV